MIIKLRRTKVSLELGYLSEPLARGKIYSICSVFSLPTSSSPLRVKYQVSSWKVDKKTNLFLMFSDRLNRNVLALLLS